jgi:hypothetical protein
VSRNRAVLLQCNDAVRHGYLVLYGVRALSLWHRDCCCPESSRSCCLYPFPTLRLPRRGCFRFTYSYQNETVALRASKWKNEQEIFTGLALYQDAPLYCCHVRH